MSRPLRLEYCGALYHITARGDRRGSIYATEADRRRFNEILSGVVERLGWRVYAWCQMTNHYHLLVETPGANLSAGMQALNGVYSSYFNRAHGRVGHVFQGRYTAIVVERESYLLELSRYIVLNPVRSGMVEQAGEWPWSSYREMCGLRQAPVWLTTEAVLSLFGTRRRAAMRRYVEFVEAGVGGMSPWHSLRNGVFLGSDAFVARHIDSLDDGSLAEVPRAQRQRQPKTLSGYRAASGSRNAAIAAAYASGSYSLKEIGDYFGLHYSRVSRIVKASLNDARQDDD